MTSFPRVSVLVTLPDSAIDVSSFLWSALRSREVSLEIVVTVDARRDPEAASVVRTVAMADDRVKVVAVDGGRGRGAATVAALDVSSAQFVTVADVDGLCTRDGYAVLSASQEASGADLVVGVAESIARNRRRIDRAMEGALNSPAQGITLSERPGLITDDRLCTKVVRRELLRAALDEAEPWNEELIVARLLTSATRIDVVTRSVYFCRHHGGQSVAKVLSAEWIAEHRHIRAAITPAAAVVRECYARGVIMRDLLGSKAFDRLGDDADSEDLGSFVRELAEDLTSTSLSNLSIVRRWQLALIALGFSSLINGVRHRGPRLRIDEIPPFDETRLAASAWLSLGIGGQDVRTAFIERFVIAPSAVSSVVDTVPGAIDVSVVVPTFNVAAYVDELLASIRSAVDVSIEVIVVDDGSTDGTWERVLAHQEVDDRVRAIRSPGAGGGQARDAGIELARGEYLAFADGDDLIPPRAYAQMLAAARRSRADIVSGNYLKFFTTTTWDAGAGYNHAYAWPVDGSRIDNHPQLVRHRAVWNRLIRRQHWLDAAFPFPGVPRSNDIVAMVSALLSAETLSVVSVPVYVYRDRPGTGSMTSAAGAVDYTVSYFSEEATCAALVQQRASEPVAREYWAMVLGSDAWKNIVKYLERRSGDEQEDSRVAKQIARLLARAPQIDLKALTPEKQAVWALSAAGRFDHALTLLRAEKSVADVRTWPLIAAIREVIGLPTVARASRNSLALKYLMRRFIDDPDWQTHAFAPALPPLRELLTDSAMPLAVVPNSLEERLARVIADGGDVDAARQAIAPTTLRFPARLEAGRDSRISGLAVELGTTVPVRLVARRYGDRQRTRIPISHVRVDERGWSAEIDPDLFPQAGVWMLELECEDAWGMRRSPLRIDDAASKSWQRRLRRLSAAKSKNNRSLVRVSDSLGVRLRRRLKRLVSA